ncbi:unnamed protein product [Leuciscus chuanchicus]
MILYTCGSISGFIQDVYVSATAVLELALASGKRDKTSAGRKTKDRRGSADDARSTQLYPTIPPMLIHVAPIRGVGCWRLLDCWSRDARQKHPDRILLKPPSDLCTCLSQRYL